ncbi:SIR2 family protein [Selenomonas sp. oral taxon 137]|uniref:SIR2 family protein n=1 Tax=Selenomonas sp. oral taxon 137 TaxID=712531 RepID=UPI00055D7BAB|nr:SIR2 family protein [Selenomonas sp. oral taxon 137]
MEKDQHKVSADNIIKVRDDREPIVFRLTSDKKKFSLEAGRCLTWCSEGVFEKGDLRARVEPWLTSLFQSEHLSLLIGSGLTTAIQYAACEKTNNCMNEETEFTVFSDEIKGAANQSAEAAGRGASNIEDQIRVANELIKGLNIMKGDNEGVIPAKKIETLSSDLEHVIETFANNILAIERDIFSAKKGKGDAAFSKLVLFLMSFASRVGTRDRLNIFTTNYDRLIEAGADIAGLRLIDRFVGAMFPIFRSSRLDIDMHYNPPGIRGEPRYLEGVARFTKLHGSLDWLNIEGHIRRIGLPFGAQGTVPFLQNAGLDEHYTSMMIYPNAAKDRETAEYPYVELFRDFAAALCRPNSTIVTYGYSFGDDHINRVIQDMLTIPSTHLVIIAYDDATGRIMDKYRTWGRESQISLIIGKDIANIDDLVDYYLPKPAIDRVSMRMADILRRRINRPFDKEQGGGEFE